MLPSTPPAPPPDGDGADAAAGQAHGADAAAEQADDGATPAAAAREGLRDDLLAAGALILGAAIVGIPLGWWWQSMAPRTRAYVDPNGFVIPEESESRISADMRALFLFVGLGLVLGAGAWLWRSRRGPIVLIGATAATAVGSASIALCGRWFSGGASHGAPRSVITLPVTLNGRAMLLIAPALCALIYVCAAIFSSDDELGRYGRAPDEASEPEVFVLGDQRRRDDGGSDPTYVSASSIS